MTRISSTTFMDPIMSNVQTPQWPNSPALLKIDKAG